MVTAICWNCGKKIKPNAFTTHQKYCCEKCGTEYRRKHKTTQYFEPFEFECSQCGKRVVIAEPNDKRTRFCCAACEKKYWKHPPHDNPSSRINFRTIGEYISYERRTNL